MLTAASVRFGLFTGIHCSDALVRFGSRLYENVRGDMTAYLEAAGAAKMRRPERLETVDEMPLTPTRKIIKDELAKLLGWRVVGRIEKGPRLAGSGHSHFARPSAA